MTFPPEPKLSIDCDECVMQHSGVCADCVVTFICDRRTDQVMAIDEAELRALRRLGRAGLVPALRHRRSAL